MSVCRNIKIVVLQRGWIAVGRLVKDEDTQECILSGASIIRRWGTTAGLGELAEKGPLANTILDQCPKAIRFHELTRVLSLDCEGAQWEKHCKH